MPVFLKTLKKATGFTLIELMITLSIISIISTVGFVTYSNSQMVARDGKRKQDLRTIATALALYKQLNGRYPCVEWNTSLDSSSYWIKDDINYATIAVPNNSPCRTNHGQVMDQKYINIMPKDPKNTGPALSIHSATVFNYTYRALECSVDGQWFVLVANLENPNDPDRIAVKSPKWCNGTDNIYPTIITHGNAFVITP